MTGRNKKKLVKHWLDQAERDWKIFLHLKRTGDFAPALFFLHLAIEKEIKAYIVEKTGTHAPFVHNLLMLWGKLDIPISKAMISDLETISKFNIEGRYPDLENKVDSWTKEDIKKWQQKAKKIQTHLRRACDAS